MSLKTVYDAANQAEARVQQIAAQIDDLMEEGKVDEATALGPQLDEAKKKSKAANDLYISMKDTGAEKKFTAPDVQVVRDEADQPFKSRGEFFRAVKNAALYPGRTDARLRPLKDATGMSEGVPADGGYLIPKEMSNVILERMYKTGQILSRVASDPVSGNTMVYNGIDETSRVAGSRWGGLRGYWLAEGGTMTSSKPKFREIELKLKKVGVLCYATDEQLEDTANLESWLGRTVPEELRFQAEDAIYEGDGVGKPLGILASPCLVSVLRYALASVSYQDVLGMWARRWAGVNDYVWFINQDVVPQLAAMSNSYALMYMPPGGLSQLPYGTLFGAPVLEVEYAQTMGTVGDIVLASMSQYQTITKGGVKADSSIHVQFVTDETAFRFIYRIDGQPMWHSALTPLHGSNTQSPFVALATATA